jgi:hypothetical protein
VYSASNAMSALPPKAGAAPKTSLFDHLVGAGKQRTDKGRRATTRDLSVSNADLDITNPLRFPPRHLQGFLLFLQAVDPSLQFRVVDLAIILYLFKHEIEPSDLTLCFVQPFHQLINVVNSCYRNDEWPHKIP